MRSRDARAQHGFWHPARRAGRAAGLSAGLAVVGAVWAALGPASQSIRPSPRALTGRDRGTTSAASVGASRAASRAVRAPGAAPRTGAVAADGIPPELLREDGRAVIHWPARVDRPLGVWIADPSDGPDAAGAADTAARARVAEAVAAWDAVGLPVRLALAPDSARADVTVGWTDRLPAPTTGRTDWRCDGGWWATHAQITLARRHADRTRIRGAELRALALHELGHALGLGHAAAAASVMAPFVVARALTPADARAARLLYALPPGPR